MELLVVIGLPVVAGVLVTWIEKANWKECTFHTWSTNILNDKLECTVCNYVSKNC